MRRIPFFVLFLLLLIFPALSVAAGENLLPTSILMAQENPDNELDTEFDEDLFDDEEEVIVFDPIEPVNRGIFWFNDKMYFYLLKPVAKVYRVVPERARVSVSKFFSNIYTPIRLVNALLQLKFKDTGTEFARFVMNTTIGIGGLFDPAKKYAGLEKKEEDFGQTLGRYGAGPGFYIVLPLFGPSNIRDGIGRIADAFLDPINYLDIKTGERIAIKSLDVVTTLSLDKDTYEGIKKDALDPYLFIRDAYAQKREGEIRK